MSLKISRNLQEKRLVKRKWSGKESHSIRTKNRVIVTADSFEMIEIVVDAMTDVEMTAVIIVVGMIVVVDEETIEVDEETTVIHVMTEDGIEVDHLEENHTMIVVMTVAMTVVIIVMIGDVILVDVMTEVTVVMVDEMIVGVTSNKSDMMTEVTVAMVDEMIVGVTSNKSDMIADLATMMTVVGIVATVVIIMGMMIGDMVDTMTDEEEDPFTMMIAAIQNMNHVTIAISLLMLTSCDLESRCHILQ